VGAGFILVAVSFLYGVFHAAGPGHGKAVISSYVLANGATVRRGITLSFLAAIVQAITAAARSANG
jgi:nickel/cobalt exporter